MTEINKTGFDYKSIQDKELRGFLMGKESEIRTSHKRAQDEVVKIGNLLQKAKDRADHGTFMEWSEGALGYTYQHIQGFIRVANMCSKVKVTLTLNLSQSALFELASPEITEEKRGEIITKLEKKEVPATVAAIKAESKREPEYTTPEVDHTDRDWKEDTQIDAPPETNGYGAPLPPAPEQTTEIINAHLEDETPVHEVTLKDFNQAQEDALSDEEWLGMLPLHGKLIAEKMQVETFTNAALAWRKVRRNYQALRRDVLSCPNYKAPDMYSVKMRSAISIEHPKTWQFSRGAAGGFLL